MPAKVAASLSDSVQRERRSGVKCWAHSIWLRACSSPGSLAIRGKYSTCSPDSASRPPECSGGLTVVLSAQSEKTSEIGLRPWYAGLLIGLGGLGDLSLYGIAAAPDNQRSRSS